MILNKETNSIQKVVHALKLNTLIKISKRGIDFYCLQHEQKQREKREYFSDQKLGF